jgi:very-short-patch-repair endonuclease
MLSHATAAAWRGLIDYPPRVVEVSSPRAVDSLAQVCVHGRRRDLERTVHNGLPVTSIPQTLLDLAASAELRLVRKALARLDYLHILNVPALNAICGCGKPGSKALRRALEIHQPRLAYVNERLEEDFLVWCEQQHITLPRVNVRVHGILVDAHWPEHNLVVELDGNDNHSSPAQLRRDRANELTLRAHGLRVVRYDWALVHGEPLRVRRDLQAQLAAAGPLASSTATGAPVARRRRRSPRRDAGPPAAAPAEPGH